MSRGKVYVIGSQKGGCAKTTSTFNLAYSLAKMRKRVLAVDFDSQANLTTCYGIQDFRESGVWDALQEDFHDFFGSQPYI